MTEQDLHKPRKWKDWEPSPEILAEAIDLMKKHPLDLWDKLKEAEMRDKGLAGESRDEMSRIAEKVVSGHFPDAEMTMNIDLYLAIRKAARDECGIVDGE